MVLKMIKNFQGWRSLIIKNVRRKKDIEEASKDKREQRPLKQRSKDREKGLRRDSEQRPSRFKIFNFSNRFLYFWPANIFKISAMVSGKNSLKMAVSRLSFGNSSRNTQIMYPIPLSSFRIYWVLTYFLNYLMITSFLEAILYVCIHERKNLCYLRWNLFEWIWIFLTYSSHVWRNNKRNLMSYGSSFI